MYDLRTVLKTLPLVAALSLSSVAPAYASIDDTRAALTAAINDRMAALQVEIDALRDEFHDPSKSPPERAAIRAEHNKLCARFLKLRIHLRRIPKMKLARLERLQDHLGIVISPS